MALPFDSETLWRAVIDRSPHLIMILDREGRVQHQNCSAVCPPLGDMSGRLLYEFLDEQSHEVARTCLAEVVASNQAGSFEAEYASEDGRRTVCGTWVVPLPDGEDEVAAIALWLQDLSEVRTTRRELAQQRNILSAIINSIADGVAVVDAQGEFLVYNQAAERLVGVIPEDVRPEDWPEYFGLFLPDKTTLYPVEKLPLLRAAAGDRAQGVEVYVKNAGQPRGVFLSVNATPLVNDRGRHQGGVAVFRDITAQKEAEERLKSEQRLLRKLLDLQESERRMIAHEIHDGFVQDVVGANMRLEAARSRIPDDLKSLTEPLQAATMLLREAIAEARRMISDLRPLIIDEDGVMEAIRHLVADFENQRGVRVEFQADEDVPEMDGRLEGAMFRIVQEALNNVSHHAETTRAELEIRHREGLLHIEIRDRGKGFDPSRVSPERFGLRGIRERARLFGGWAVIESRPGRGTTVRVELPVRPSIETEP